MFSSRAGDSRRLPRPEPRACAEHPNNPVAYAEPRSSVPMVPVREPPYWRLPEDRGTAYELVGGDTWSHRRLSYNNSISSSSQSRASGVRSGRAAANEGKECWEDVLKREIDDWHQEEAIIQAGSALVRSLPITMSPSQMKELLVTAPLSLDSDTTDCGFDDTANPALVYQGLDLFSNSGETDRAGGNQDPVGCDGESFVATSSMSHEMDMASSGEESFVFGSQSPPSFDVGSWHEIEQLVLEIGQDLMRGFMSGRGEMKVHTPQSTQESTRSPTDGNPALTGSCSSTLDVSNAVGSTRKNKRGELDGNEEPRRPQRPRIESPIPDDLDSEGLFACPYAKYDPNRYSEMNQNPHEKPYRRCRSVYLTNIPRLKQHLYRIHRRPEYFCSSCYTKFESEGDCEDHARARPACVLKECPFQEKMTHEQYKAVKRRKMRRDATSVWYGIFDILFPSAQRPSTPYVDEAICPATMASLRDYNTYLETNLLRRLSERIEGPLFNAEPGMFQWLVNRALEETLPTLLRELNEEYQKLQSVEGTSDNSS